MTDTLTDEAKALVDRPIVATFIANVADGAPQATVVWIDTDGDDLRINTARGRKKDVNVARDPRVTVSVIDPEDAYNVLIVRGTVVEVTEDGADAHIDSLAKKYLGADSYPFRRPGEVRITMRIRTDRIVTQPEDA